MKKSITRAAILTGAILFANVAVENAAPIRTAVPAADRVMRQVTIPTGTQESEMERIALENDTIRRMVEGKTIRRVITVKDKLVNVIAG